MLQISPLNPRDCQISRSYFSKQIGNSVTHVITSHPNDRTTVSFKTPEQHTRTVVEHTVIRKQPAIATPLFKKVSRCSVHGNSKIFF